MRKSAIVAIVLAAALTLGGCTSHPGAAAVVDGRTISTSTVDRATRELNELFTVDPRGVLTMLIVAPVYLDEASGLGIGKSREEARDYLADVAQVNDLDLDLDTVSDATLDILAFDMAVQEMRLLIDTEDLGERLRSRIDALDVEVNPRFGSFEGSVVSATTPEWIVQAP